MSKGPNVQKETEISLLKGSLIVSFLLRLNEKIPIWKALVKKVNFLI